MTLLATGWLILLYLDEGANQEEAVGKANLHTAQDWGDASSVRRQVGEVPSDDARGCHWGLKHTHEWVIVDGLDDLSLRVARKEFDAESKSRIPSPRVEKPCLLPFADPPALQTACCHLCWVADLVLSSLHDEPAGATESWTSEWARLLGTHGHARLLKGERHFCKREGDGCREREQMGLDLPSPHTRITPFFLASLARSLSLPPA